MLGGMMSNSNIIGAEAYRLEVPKLDEVRYAYLQKSLFKDLVRSKSKLNIFVGVVLGMVLAGVSIFFAGDISGFV